MYKIYIFIYLLHFFNNLFNFHLFLIFKYLSNLIYVITLKIIEIRSTTKL